jgi:HSP20 family protein
MDVTETENEVMITAELPGLDAKDFDITLVGDVLTIKGEKKFERQQDIGNGRFMERRYGSFARSLTLPFAVAEEKIDANYDKGVLTIRIPKPAEMKRTARRIEVKSA